MFEEDFSTVSYLGEFYNGLKFRVIRPTHSSFINIKEQFNCETAFSVASLNPDGYAVHFLLLDANQDDLEIPLIEKGKDEQIQKLIDGSFMALRHGLQDNFIDFSKRLLSLVKNTNELLRYSNSKQVVDIIKDNRDFYDESERIKIK